MTKKEYYEIRKVEALWRKNFTVDEIVRATKLQKIRVLDITQKIFGQDMKKRRD